MINNTNHGSIETLLDKLFPNTSRIPPGLEDKGKNLSLENLLKNYNRIGDKKFSQYVKALIIDKLYKAYPKELKFIEVLIFAMDLIVESQEDVETISYYIDSILQTIHTTLELEDIMPLAQASSKLKNLIGKDPLSFVSISNSINIEMWERIGNIIKNPKEDYILSTLKRIKEFTKLGLSLDDTNAILVPLVLNHLEKKDITQGDANQNYDIVSLIKRLKIEDSRISPLKKELRKLRKKNKVSEPISVRSRDKKKFDFGDIDIKDFDFEPEIDDDPPIYSKKADDCQVFIYKYTHKGTPVAMKIYKVTDKKYMDAIYNEIKCYQMLSDLSDNSNCFLKFHGAKILPNCVKMLMEWQEYDLMSYMTKLKKKNLEIGENSFKEICFSLINSFCIMENMHIIHGDIKPHNILVDNEWNMKIIDFNASVIKNEEITNATSGRRPMQATAGYSAPEIEEMMVTGVKNNCKRSIADVFSLGMTLLQLVKLQRLEGLNTYLRNDDLLRVVSTVPYDWARSLLSSMLNKDPKKRSTFKESLQFIRDAQTRTVTMIKG